MLVPPEILEGTDMNYEQASEAAKCIFDGSATPNQIASLLTALKIKGESNVEIVAFAKAMKEQAIKIQPKVSGLVDTCGTGGDGYGTFNISTASAIISAAAGAKIAKHGNRAVSGKSGSADVLEKLGVRILQPEEVERSIEKIGFGFMFAPYFHPAMKRVAEVRRELGFRTIFNILGPLTNPAGAKIQVLGVFDPSLCEKMAECLLELGSERAMVVHSNGMDEIGLGKTTVTELKNGKIENFGIDGTEFGFKNIELPKVNSSDESARIILNVLSGKCEAAQDVCVINSAAALYVSGNATSLEDGIKKAKTAIDSGAAMQKLDEIRKFTMNTSGAGEYD